MDDWAHLVWVTESGNVRSSSWGQPRSPLPPCSKYLLEAMSGEVHWLHQWRSLRIAPSVCPAPNAIFSQPPSLFTLSLLRFFEYSQKKQSVRGVWVTRQEGADCPHRRMFKFDAALNATATRRRSPNHQLGDVDTWTLNGAFCVRPSTMAQEAVLLEAADWGQVHKRSMKTVSLFRPECCSAGSVFCSGRVRSCRRVCWTAHVFFMSQQSRSQFTVLFHHVATGYVCHWAILFPVTCSRPLTLV